MSEEYNGPERRQGTPLSTALTSIMDLQGEVEVLARVVSSTRETQEQAQRKITLLGVALALIIGLFAINAVTLQNVRTAANASRTASTTLQDCLLSGGVCYAELAERGSQGSVRQMKFQACVLSQIPETRTTERLVACARKAYPEIENLEMQLKEALR
jgi:hypothetical protein